MPWHIPQTGQQDCYAADGRAIDCAGSGQDGQWRHGRSWPEPRFRPQDAMVRDALTGLIWSRDAAPLEFPLTWSEALEAVARLNRDAYLGQHDWRLPNRRELHSLVDHQSPRALALDHPFTNLFAGWYWSSTTAVLSPAHAWYVDMDGGRLFYGGKDQSFMFWPVRGHSNLARTGQQCCYDGSGQAIECAGSAQDAELACGLAWPQPRLLRDGGVVTDRLTGMQWLADADLAKGAVTWERALATVQGLASELAERPWRLPNINELESLVDCAHAAPALPQPAPFDKVREAYWSATTSCYAPDWAWALYLTKGAVGVGQKRGPHFHVMAVR